MAAKQVRALLLGRTRRVSSSEHLRADLLHRPTNRGTSRFCGGATPSSCISLLCVDACLAWRCQGSPGAAVGIAKTLPPPRLQSCSPDHRCPTVAYIYTPCALSPSLFPPANGERGAASAAHQWLRGALGVGCYAVRPPSLHSSRAQLLAPPSGGGGGPALPHTAASPGRRGKAAPVVAASPPLAGTVLNYGLQTLAIRGTVMGGGDAQLRPSGL